MQGRYRISDGNIGGGFFGLKKCSDELKQYKQKPLVKHSGGFVGGEESLRSLPNAGAPWLATAAAAGPAARASAGESQGFTLPSGTTGQELRIGFAGSAPPVHIKGPSGQVFTTPATPGQFVTVGGEFIAAIGPDGHETIVFLRKPKGGEWQLQADGGTPIAKLEAAQDIPPATIKAAVKHKHGSRFALSYKIANFVPGTHVRFVERGKDSTHVLGVVGGAHGTLTFTPQEGLSRSRTIVAYLLDSEGAPRRELTVGHYSAPGALRGGRVRKVKFVRHGSTGVITWSATAGARQYRIKVRGGDGRVQTFIRKPSARSVTVTGLIPTDSYTAVVVARAGRNLLPGLRANATLKALKTPKPVPVKGKKKKH